MLDDAVGLSRGDALEQLPRLPFVVRAPDVARDCIVVEDNLAVCVWVSGNGRVSLGTAPGTGTELAGRMKRTLVSSK